MAAMKRFVRPALFWTLLAGMALWAAYMFRRASNELRGGQVVEGLFRSYHPPYRHELGWVIDPKDSRLAHELWVRFGTGEPVDTHEDWESICRRLHWRMRPYEAEELLKSPSFLFRSDSTVPDLWLGNYGLSHVVFREDLGVFTTEKLPKYVRRLAIEQSGLPSR